jgi:site-specific recombinase XerD
MESEYFISIVLDKRREKKNKKFPVKLRVFTPYPRKQILYPTKFEFNEDEFKSIWETKKPRNEHKEIRTLLRAIEEKAEKAAKELTYFTFKEFENKLFQTYRKGQKDIVFYYNQAIEQYKKNRQIGTASNYAYSLKSLLEFQDNGKLDFILITSQWLKDFETYLLMKGKSQTTVGMYLRPLRAIFNAAINDKIIQPEQYPFGKKKYEIPNPKGVKKALSKDQLKNLFDTEPITEEQKKAKAFWFFSYACNGMNFKDIANLQFKDISGDNLTFRRAKTTNTNKNQAPVIVYINEFTQSVINNFGNEKLSSETYIFSIINHNSTPEEQHSQLKNFIRYVNQHFKKFAKSTGIKEKVSTYWARHTFATTAIRNGASLEFVSEALSHSNLKTTIGYFAGFEDEKKREISKKMMDF